MIFKPESGWEQLDMVTGASNELKKYQWLAVSRSEESQEFPLNTQDMSEE